MKFIQYNNPEADKIQKKKRQKYLIQETIRKFLFVCALVVFTYCSYALTNILLDYKDGDDTYDSLEKMLNAVGEDGEDGDYAGGSSSNSADSKNWKLDFAALKNLNNDAVGWIKQGNIISYPILVGTDNTYYLTHNANHQENKNGSIFLDYRVTGGLNAQNCIIYGHDMNNGAMFGSLVKYDDESYYKKHPTFEIYIGQQCYEYKVFAAYETDAIGSTYSYNFTSNESFKKYVDECISKRLYKTNVKEVKATDHIITLSTCTRHDSSKRFVVQIVRGDKIDK